MFNARVACVLALVAAVALVGACSTSGSPAPKPSGSSSSVPAPTSSSASTAATQGKLNLVLTTAELPSDASWTQKSEGLLNNNPATGQRVWLSANSSRSLEVDVYDTGSAANAQAAYQTWDEHSASTLTSPVKQACTQGAPAQCDLKTDVDTSGKHAAVLTFAQGRVLVAIVETDSSTAIDANAIQTVGGREVQHLTNILGGTPSSSAAPAGHAFAVPVTDAAATVRVLIAQAAKGPITSGTPQLWTTDGIQLDGYANPATPTSLSGYGFVGKQTQFLAFAVKDTTGHCVGAVLFANASASQVTGSEIIPTLTGPCSGATVRTQKHLN